MLLLQNSLKMKCMVWSRNSEGQLFLFRSIFQKVLPDIAKKNTFNFYIFRSDLFLKLKLYCS